MAHIDYTFTMAVEPSAAQEQFLNDLLPDLAKDGQFHLERQRAGELVFSDAIDIDEGREEEAAAMRSERVVGDEEGLTDDAPPAADSFEGPGRAAGMVGAPDGAGTFWGSVPLNMSGSETLFGRHLHVEFSAAAGGTEVHIHGRASRAVRDGLARLGTAGHWPETAGRPHD